MRKILLLLLLSCVGLFAQYSPANYCADAGANDTYACNLSPSPIAYVTGTTYFFKANTANTGAATINYNGIGAITIVKVAGGVPTTLSDNDIRAGQIVELTYDGTNMQMQSTLGNAAGAGSGGTAGSPLAVQTSSVTVTSNAESTLIGTVAGSLTIPANWFTSAGTVMEVCGSGVMTTAAAAQGTAQFKLKFGSTVVAQTGAFTPTASLSNNAYDFCVRLTARTVGGTGTIMATNIFPLVAPGLATPDLTNFTNPTPGTAVTVDTTATQVLNLTVTWSANATNSITQTNFYMVGPGSAVSSVNGLTGAVTGMVQASSPGAGIAHFAGSTQMATSSAVNLAGGTNEITGVLPATNAPAGSWVLLSEQVLGGTAATVTFSSISASYRNLMLVIVGRTDPSANSQDCYIQFNGDTAGNYARQFIEAHAGNNLDGGINTATAKVGVITMTAANALANAPGMASVIIPNYSGTTFFKIGVNYGGFYVDGATTGSQRIQPVGIVWSNTAAINAIVVGLTGAGNFIAGSTFDLYAQ